MAIVDRVAKLRAWPAGLYLLFAALAGLTLLGLGEAFGNGDEIIYAQNIREMRDSGDWGVLQWQGVSTFQRPTAPFVLSMASGSLLGGEFGLRLPMALFSLVTLAIVYAASWLSTRRHDAASVATVLCASVPSFHLFTRSLLSDAPFVAMTSLALLGTLWSLRDKRGIVLAAAGLGGAVAVKSLAAGPIGLAMAPWLLYAVYRHRAYKTLLPASLCFALLALPYYVYSYSRFGSDFLEGHFGWTLGKRLAGDYGSTVGLSGGLTAYPRHLWGADGPITVLWLVVATGGALYLWRRGDKLSGCAACTSLAVLVVFSLFGTHLPHYILAIYPGLAIAFAGVYAALADRWRPSSPFLSRILVASLLLAVTMLGVSRPMPASYLLPSPAAVAVGTKIARLADTRPFYTLDWYAPAAAYYGQKPWQGLFTSRDLSESLNSGILFFEKAGNIHAVPPWPTGKYLIAGPTQSLRAAQLPVTDIILELGDSFVLAKVDAGND